jgi:hypothetical protein
VAIATAAPVPATRGVHRPLLITGALLAAVLASLGWYLHRPLRPPPPVNVVIADDVD